MNNEAFANVLLIDRHQLNVSFIIKRKQKKENYYKAFLFQAN